MHEKCVVTNSARITGEGGGRRGDFLPTTYRRPRHYNSSASVTPSPP